MAFLLSVLTSGEYIIYSPPLNSFPHSIERLLRQRSLNIPSLHSLLSHQPTDACQTSFEWEEEEGSGGGSRRSSCAEKYQYHSRSLCRCCGEGQLGTSRCAHRMCTHRLPALSRVHALLAEESLLVEPRPLCAEQWSRLCPSVQHAPSYGVLHLYGRPQAIQAAWVSYARTS